MTIMQLADKKIELMKGLTSIMDLLDNEAIRDDAGLISFTDVLEFKRRDIHDQLDFIEAQIDAYDEYFMNMADKIEDEESIEEEEEWIYLSIQIPGCELSKNMGSVEEFVQNALNKRAEEETLNRIYDYGLEKGWLK